MVSGLKDCGLGGHAWRKMEVYLQVLLVRPTDRERTPGESFDLEASWLFDTASYPQLHLGI